MGMCTRRCRFARGLALWLLGHSAAFPVLAQTPAAGALPGQFVVSPTGAATYTIPLQVPPGTAGIEPKLSLNYNSQAGNGLLGVGWSLGGLSGIHRCPKTLAQDGVKGGINYDANDRYCLDSQRLVAISGAYGADGTEYRTERESFAKIVSYGNAGNGPAWWKVWTKAGQVMEYGNTADSRIEAQGKSSARLWALNRLADTKGNFLAVTYAEDSANGHYYPTRIDYGGNSNTGGDHSASVQLTYEARTDATPLYAAGSLIRQTNRLTKVQSISAANVVKEYRLSYETSSSSERSRLSSVQECLDTTCFSPTVFVYRNGSVGLSPAVAWGSTGSLPTIANWYASDVNGDGKPDIIYQDSHNGYWVSLSTGTSFAAPTLWINHGGDYTAGQTQFADLNGDGKADLVFQSTYNLFLVSMSTGSGFTTPVLWLNHGGNFTAGQAQYADVNGDGRADLIFQSTYNLFLVSLSTGSGFTPPAQWLSYGGVFTPGQAQYFNINGDGQADLVFQSTNNSFLVSLSTGAGFTPSTQWLSYGGSFDPGQAQYADVNGDGIPDLIFQSTYNHFLVSLCTGTGFIPSTEWISYGGVYTAGQSQYADANSDGKADLFFQSTYNSFLSSSSTGTTFTPSITLLTVPGVFSPGQARYADVSGDGLPDLVFRDGGGTTSVALNTGTVPDLLASITTGLGTTTNISYSPLTESSVYAKANNATYPYMDLQVPMYVTSTVSASDGIGGNRTTEYHYAGLQGHIEGGGLLGFGQVEVTDQASGLKTVTTSRQDYPYHGLPLSAVTQTAGGTVLKRVTNTWSDFLLTPAAGSGGKYHKSQLARSVEEGFELSGAPIGTVTTDSQYDLYGNATQIVVSMGDGFSKTTTNQYQNDTTNWFLGRLVRSVVTSTRP